MTWLKTLVAGSFVLGLCLLLWALVRWSIVSAWRTRGSEARLRRPERDGIARLCGIAVPNALVEMYKSDSLVERSEFVLAASDGREWEIGFFLPLAVVDAKEWRALSGVPGIPIAMDCDKGTYYVSSSGSVVFRPPGRDSEMTVAPSVDAFRAMQVREIAVDADDA